MRIAFITPEYITEKNFYGGLANYLYRACTLLDKREHNILLFTLSDENKTVVDNGVFVYKIKIPKILLKIINRYPLKKINIALTNLLGSYFIYKKLMQEHNKKKIDIIQNASYCYLGYFLAKKNKIPVVTRMSSLTSILRTLQNAKTNFNNSLNEFFEIKTLELSTGVYSPSQLLKNILKYYSPIDINVIKPPFLLKINKRFNDEILLKYNLNNKKYFLYYGTICEFKGVELIIRNLNKILDKHQNLFFVFIGDSNPKYINHIKKVCNKHINRIIIIEALRHNQLIPIIKNSHAIILPSLIENLPNTCIESMSLGKIVVGTLNSSMEELIKDGFSGFLIHKNNDENFCKTINQILKLTDKELHTMGKNAVEVTKKLDPKITLYNLEKYYESIIIKHSC